jgi:putative membrane protein
MHVEARAELEIARGLAGYERLANTVLPFAYTLLLHRTAYLFCFLLPFGLADTLGWSVPLAVVLVGYTFFGLYALGEELEETSARAE